MIIHNRKTYHISSSSPSRSRWLSTINIHTYHITSSSSLSSSSSRSRWLSTIEKHTYHISSSSSSSPSSSRCKWLSTYISTLSTLIPQAVVASSSTVWDFFIQISNSNLERLKFLSFWIVMFSISLVFNFINWSSVLNPPFRSPSNSTLWIWSIMEGEGGRGYLPNPYLPFHHF